MNKKWFEAESDRRHGRRQFAHFMNLFKYWPSDISFSWKLDFDRLYSNGIQAAHTHTKSGIWWDILLMYNFGKIAAIWCVAWSRSAGQQIAKWFEEFSGENWLPRYQDVLCVCVCVNGCRPGNLFAGHSNTQNAKFKSKMVNRTTTMQTNHKTAISNEKWVKRMH